MFKAAPNGHTRRQGETQAVGERGETRYRSNMGITAHFQSLLEGIYSVALVGDWNSCVNVEFSVSENSGNCRTCSPLFQCWKGVWGGGVSRAVFAHPASTSVEAYCLFNLDKKTLWFLREYVSWLGAVMSCRLITTMRLSGNQRKLLESTAPNPNSPPHKPPGKITTCHFYTLVFAPIKQMRYNTLISEPYRCWEVHFVTFGQIQASRFPLFPVLSTLTISWL